MAPALDSALVRKLRGMERRFAILSHYGPGTGSGLSIEFRPDRDQNSIDLHRRRLLVGLRPFIGDSQMEAVVPVAVEMAMDQTRWQTLPFDPEAFGCPEPLFLLLEQRKTLLRMESDKSFRTSQRLLLYARLKSRRLEESDSFRKGKTFILDPYHLGQRVLLSLSGSQVLFPDRRYPARFYLLKPFFGFPARDPTGNSFRPGATCSARRIPRKDLRRRPGKEPFSGSNGTKCSTGISVPPDPLPSLSETFPNRFRAIRLPGIFRLLPETIENLPGIRRHGLFEKKGKREKKREERGWDWRQKTPWTREGRTFRPLNLPRRLLPSSNGTNG